MTFTALHRLLGLPPSPLSDAMIDNAVAEKIEETHDLDFKSALPGTSGLNVTDFPKDIAAMANSGGGVIVYGITEQDKRAVERVDVGELAEGHERTLRSVAVTAISPPVFSLDIVRLGDDGERCVAIIVPASVDGPHLIYRGEYFGAPVRNDADTVWMKERQVEAAYRTRFNERRHATDAIDHMYEELAVVTKTESRAWLIAVGRPRVTPTTPTRWDRDEARRLFVHSSERSLTYAERQTNSRPFEIIDVKNPLPGLRRWVVRRHSSEPSWYEGTASIHFDGSVSVAFALGGHRSGPESAYTAWEFDSAAVEGAVADFMGVVRVVSAHIGSVDYEVRIGIERNGLERMIMHTVDGHGQPYSGVSTPMHQFTPVEATIEVGTEEDRFLHQVRVLVQDCVNQGGVTTLRTLAACTCEECQK